ncbi:MAG: putative phage protein (TIGR02216 family) [Yoonia sp.]
MKFDWAALLKAGVRGLGLQPDQFWRLTPAEFRLMLGIDAGSAPMSRSALDALSQAYPDEKRTFEDG